jgi:membrane protein DedA with SNARE-associated domain
MRLLTRWLAAAAGLVPEISDAVMVEARAVYPYWLVYFTLIGVGFGIPPLPEEIPVVVAGGLAGHPENHIRWWVMLPVCIAGVVTSDGLLYLIGRIWGPRLVQYRWVRQRFLPPDKLVRIERNFHEYGIKILLVARVLPGIRSPIFITAGIMRLRFTHFLLADGIYAVPGVSLLFGLGYWFTDQFLEVLNRAERLRPLLIVVILAAVGTYLFFHFVHSPVSMGDPKEVPLVGEQVAAKLSAELHPEVPDTPESILEPPAAASEPLPAEDARTT